MSGFEHLPLSLSIHSQPRPLTICHSVLTLGLFFNTHFPVGLTLSHPDVTKKEGGGGIREGLVRVRGLIREGLVREEVY